MPSPKFGVRYFVEGGANNEVVGNLAINFLEQIGQFLCVSRVTTAEPGSPAEGDTYILPASPTGSNWSGHGGEIALYFNGWYFFAPVEGTRAYIQDKNEHAVYDGTNWITLWREKNIREHIFLPVAASELPLDYTEGAWTVLTVETVIRGGTSIPWMMKYGANRDGTSSTDMYSGTQTTSSKTTANQHNTLSAEPPGAGNWVWIDFDTPTGTIDEFFVKVVVTEEVP